LIPDSTPQPVREAPNGSERTSENVSPTVEDEDMPEDENRKVEIIGNPVFDPKFKVRRSGKRIADFALATHEKEGETKYYRVRAFDKRAEYVRDNLRKGQKDVKCVLYGPKHWRQQKKLKDGTWTQEVVEGYYTGMVRVPKRYREDKSPKSQEEK
jgi:Single-strand binding protein family